ncbi:TolC family protein [bacterium]|nr:TolC family protein [bacterium]
MSRREIRITQQHARRWPARLILVACLTALPSMLAAQTTLTAEEVRRRALEFNRHYLSAQEDVKIAQSEVIRARADAFPQLNFTGTYNRSFRVPSVFFVVNGETTELQTGFKNAYGAQVALSQTLWQGGKVFTAIDIARRYKRYAEATAEQVRAEIVYQADLLFYGAILAESQLDVLSEALASNTANLEVTKQKFDQGLVSEYEVLRATVEKQNLLPQILSAQSNLRLARKQLKSFIGVDLTEPVELVDPETDTSLTGLPELQMLTDTAQVARPEIEQASELVGISSRGIKIAQAEYWPALEAVAAWDWQSASDDFTLSKNNSNSWTAGLRLSFPIFDGFRRSGDVRERKAQFAQARLSLKQTKDDIALEVEDAYDRLRQAKQAVDIQGATIAAAKEGLKIAKLRYESGVGTQLEVLSAQTALTEARRLQAEAIYSFRAARAGLKKATTIGIGTEQ